jgi:hypothetical protein
MEIITGVERHRRWRREEELKIVAPAERVWLVNGHTDMRSRVCGLALTPYGASVPLVPRCCHAHRRPC